MSRFVESLSLDAQKIVKSLGYSLGIGVCHEISAANNDFSKASMFRLEDETLHNLEEIAHASIFLLQNQVMDIYPEKFAELVAMGAAEAFSNWAKYAEENNDWIIA